MSDLEDAFTRASRRIAKTAMEDSKGMTVSAIAWDRTGTSLPWTSLQVGLDMFFLCFKLQRSHCEASYHREMRRYSLNQNDHSVMTDVSEPHGS